MIDKERLLGMRTTDDIILLGEELLQSEEYSGAYWLFFGAKVNSMREGDLEKAERIDKNYLSLISQKIDEEFRRIADERGLVLTPDNYDTLFNEHSPHVAELTKMKDLAMESTEAYKKGTFQTYLIENIVKLNTRLQKKQDLDYLMEQAEEIAGWDYGQEPPQIDLTKCYSGLELLTEEDIEGEYEDVVTALRERLDKIKSYRE